MLSSLFKLNAKGYNLLQNKKMEDAFDTFELTMTLYPRSINTYDSYGEASLKKLTNGVLNSPQVNAPLPPPPSRPQ